MAAYEPIQLGSNPSPPEYGVISLPSLTGYPILGLF
jgi:hypothetical protein